MINNNNFNMHIQEIDSIETVEEYNNDIENALDNISQGNFVAEEEAKSISKKWNRK